MTMHTRSSLNEFSNPHSALLNYTPKMRCRMINNQLLRRCFLHLAWICRQVQGKVFLVLRLSKLRLKFLQLTFNRQSISFNV